MVLVPNCPLFWGSSVHPILCDPCNLSCMVTAPKSLQACSAVVRHNTFCIVITGEEAQPSHAKLGLLATSMWKLSCWMWESSVLLWPELVRWAHIACLVVFAVYGVSCPRCPQNQYLYRVFQMVACYWYKNPPCLYTPSTGDCRIFAPRMQNPKSAKRSLFGISSGL